jgi:hypothetical protein
MVVNVVINVVIRCGYMLPHRPQGAPGGSYHIYLVQHVDVTCLARECHVDITRASRGCHVSFTWMSRGCHVNFTYL